MDSTVKKTYVIEEHNEAFFVWKKSISQGILKEQGNVLYHIDEHSDMSPPSLNISLHDLGCDFQEIVNFTYAELNIASFIAPALFQKIFSKVFWIKQKHHNLSSLHSKLYVRSYNQLGQKLSIGQTKTLKGFSGINKKFKDDLLTFDYYNAQISEIHGNKDAVLDIDLDYFSCIQNPLLKSLQIEISKEEYEKFNSSKYHRMRYFDFGRVETSTSNDRFYYSLNNYSYEYQSSLLVSNAVVKSRIQDVIDNLVRYKIDPQIITICRSRYSGYTPIDQWEYIEENLISALTNIYNIEKCYVDEIN